ncbi:MAG: 50S ribosome-binding GTPase [Dictyoglomus sp.]|nr:50S ribosome-binding GTPase [Dictyoglomus sp.]MCX7941499.1 50S ribosome-binding GTPase [Dictyoglomaceae bacterium]MDW8188848.1 GTPase [Dictyoglomus sp.]
MPANLPPQYFEAEKRYREAKTIEDKIQALKEMLAILPKHKGTDKMKADLRRKLSQLMEEAEKRPKKGGRGMDYIEKEGAGQVVIIGPPNTGKSTFFKTLTNVDTLIADYPFSTINHTLGMMPYENIQIQLIDLPPLWENTESWIYNIIRYCDLTIVFLDMESLSLVDDYLKIKDLLGNKKIKLVRENPDRDPYAPIKEVKSMIIINKIDLITPLERKEEIDVLKEELNVYCISAKEGINMEEIKRNIFNELNIVRIYTKKPGYPPDLDTPYILPKGSTVLDVAELVHKDIAKNLKYTKLYTKDGKIKGLPVEKSYELKDEEILEFHT